MIYVTKDADFTTVFKHELFHHLSQSNQFNELQNTIEQLEEIVINNPEKIFMAIERKNGMISLFFDINPTNMSDAFMQISIKPNSKMYNNSIEINEIRSIFGRKDLDKLIYDELNGYDSTIIEKNSIQPYGQYNMAGTDAIFKSNISKISKMSTVNYDENDNIIINNSSSVVDAVSIKNGIIENCDIFLAETVIGNNQYIVRFVGLKNGDIDHMYAIKKNQISEQPKEAVKANLILEITIKQLLDDVNYVDNL